MADSQSPEKILTAGVLRRITGPNQTRAWLFDLRKLAGFDQEVKQYLSQAELRQNAVIGSPTGKSRFCLRKGVIRLLLGHVLGIAPIRVKYEYDCYGKPFIANERCRGWGFNLAHSGDYLLIGLVEKGRIGVDIERFKPQLQVDGLAESVFTPAERLIYNDCPPKEQLQFFYQTWVQKEAVGKAMGLGLAVGFAGFAVKASPGVADVQYCLRVEALKSEFAIMVLTECDYAFSIAIANSAWDEN